MLKAYVQKRHHQPPSEHRLYDYVKGHRKRQARKHGKDQDMVKELLATFDGAPLAPRKQRVTMRRIGLRSSKKAKVSGWCGCDSEDITA